MKGRKKASKLCEAAGIGPLLSVGGSAWGDSGGRQLVLNRMKNRDLGTELCVAVADADPRMVEELLAEGADVNAVGDRRIATVAQRTPLWLAVNGAGHILSESWNQLCATISEAFPDRPARDEAKRRERFTQIVQTLLHAKADSEIQSFGTTPLAQAAHAADAEMVKLLLSIGANANAESLSVLSKLAKKERKKGPLGFMGYYNTVLHTAVEKNSPAIVKMLLTAGADSTRIDHEGMTALDIARRSNETEVIALLERTKAT